MPVSGALRSAGHRSLRVSGGVEVWQEGGLTPFVLSVRVGTCEGCRVCVRGRESAERPTATQTLDTGSGEFRSKMSRATSSVVMSAVITPDRALDSMARAFPGRGGAHLFAFSIPNRQRSRDRRHEALRFGPAPTRCPSALVRGLRDGIHVQERFSDLRCRDKVGRQA